MAFQSATGAAALRMATLRDSDGGQRQQATRRRSSVEARGPTETSRMDRLTTLTTLAVILHSGTIIRVKRRQPIDD
jgi:hypothetical protein